MCYNKVEKKNRSKGEGPETPTPKNHLGLPGPETPRRDRNATKRDIGTASDPEGRAGKRSTDRRERSKDAPWKKLRKIPLGSHRTLPRSRPDCLPIRTG